MTQIVNLLNDVLLTIFMLKATSIYYFIVSFSRWRDCSRSWQMSTEFVHYYICAPSEDSAQPADVVQSVFRRTAKTDQTAQMYRLICSSLGAHAILQEMLCPGLTESYHSYCFQKKKKKKCLLCLANFSAIGRHVA